MGDEEYLRELLRKWMELGERTMTDHITRLDANRAVDFAQGVRETREFLDEKGG